MIRLVKKIVALNLNDSDEQPFLVPIVPASAILEMKETVDDAGRLINYEFSATLTAVPEKLRGELSLKLIFDTGKYLELGTPSIPITFEVKMNNAIRVSFRYTIPYNNVLSI